MLTEPEHGRGIHYREPRLFFAPGSPIRRRCVPCVAENHDMKVTVSYTKSQVLQALRYHFIKKPEIRLMIILVNVFALVSAGLFAFRVISALPFLMGTTLWMTMMVTFWFWMPWLIYRRSRTFRDHFAARLESQHFFLDFGHREKAWSWREFSHYFESPHFFHLYFDPRSFFLLPKDGFEHPSDVREARKLLAGQIGKTA